MFQYPLVDRVGFEGRNLHAASAAVAKFQYPLVDRVGFEGAPTSLTATNTPSFSILWWIELVLRAKRVSGKQNAMPVSVSSGGSSWF